MKLGDLITLFREESGDKKRAYLWSDALLIEYANEAQLEAARRARLFVDSTTDEICVIPVEVGGRLFELDPRIIFVRRVKLGSKAPPLGKVHRADLDELAPGFEDAANSSPIAYCTDYQSGSLLLHPPSDAVDTLRLTVVREPLVDMTKPTDEPEVAKRYQRGLVQWMLFRAFSKQDSETNDPKKAAAAEALFEAEFGKRSSAIDETWIERENGYDDRDGVF